MRVTYSYEPECATRKIARRVQEAVRTMAIQQNLQMNIGVAGTVVMIECFDEPTADYVQAYTDGAIDVLEDTREDCGHSVAHGCTDNSCIADEDKT